MSYFLVLLAPLFATAALLPTPQLHALRHTTTASPRTPSSPALDETPKPRPSVRYITESEMEVFVRTAAIEQGVPPAEAQMYASCSRNIYGIGCVYPSETIKRIEDILIAPAKAGEGWALLMLQCERGLLPRLRSEPTALARMRAARGAAARRKQQEARVS